MIIKDKKKKDKKKTKKQPKKTVRKSSISNRCATLSASLYNFLHKEERLLTEPIWRYEQGISIICDFARMDVPKILINTMILLKIVPKPF